MYMGGAARGLIKVEGDRNAGRGGRAGGRGRGPNPRHRQGGNKGGNPKQTSSFQGRIPELKGHIFDCTHAGSAEKVDRSLQEARDYIGTQLRSGGAEVKYTIEREIEYPFVAPVEPTPTGTTAAPIPVTRAQEITFESNLKAHLKEIQQYRSDCKYAYSIIWQQCSEAMRNRLKTVRNWENISTTQNVIELVKATKALCYKYEGHRHPTMALVRAKSRVYTCFQGSMGDAEFAERFNSVVSIVEQQGGQFSETGLITQKMATDGTDPSDVNAVAAA